MIKDEEATTQTGFFKNNFNIFPSSKTSIYTVRQWENMLMCD